MTASNRPRRPAARRQVPRRPVCLPAAPRTLRWQDGERVLIEPPTTNGLKVTVRVIPLPEAENNPLRARQLAVIVDLLRRATAEAEQENAATRRRRTKGG